MANPNNGAPFWIKSENNVWKQPEAGEYENSFLAMPFDNNQHYQMPLFTDGMMVGATYQHQSHEQDVDANPDEYLEANNSKQRLRWTPQLHDQFVRVVDELGGANKATPKTIQNLMGVEGITLLHLKSHLQKYRNGKSGKKLSKKTIVGQDDAKPYSSSSKRHEPSFLVVGTYDKNVSRNELQAKKVNSTTNGTQHHQLFQDGTFGGPATMECFTPMNPSLLPLFPTSGMDCSSSRYPEW